MKSSLLLCLTFLVHLRVSGVSGGKEADFGSAKPYQVILVNTLGGGLLKFMRGDFADYAVLDTGGGSILLEKVSSPHEWYVVAVANAEALAVELDVLGAKGFRLASKVSLFLTNPGLLKRKMDVLMEKPPGSPKRFQYRVLKVKKDSLLQIEISRAAEQGYEVAAVERGDPGRILILQSRPPSRGEPEALPDSGPRYDRLRTFLVLETVKMATLQKELNLAVAMGYWFTRISEYSNLVVLEKTANTDRKEEYLLVGARGAAHLEEDLNRAALSGYRARPGSLYKSLVDDVVIMEKGFSSSGGYRYHYLVLNTSRRSTLVKEILELAEQEYKPVAIHGFTVVMEKAEKSSPE